MPAAQVSSGRWRARRDRGREGRIELRLPSLRTVTCGSPAHGSPVGGSPPSGLTGRSAGCRQGEQTRARQSRRWASGDGPRRVPPSSPCSVPKDAAQAHSYPSVERAKGGVVAVFEVFKPAPQVRVNVRDDRVEALAVGPFRFGANRVFELREALLAGPVHASLEVVAEEVEAARGGVDDAGLLRVECQAGLAGPLWRSASAWCASSSVWHRMTKSSA